MTSLWACVSIIFFCRPFHSYLLESSGYSLYATASTTVYLAREHCDTRSPTGSCCRGRTHAFFRHRHANYISSGGGLIPLGVGQLTVQRAVSLFQAGRQWLPGRCPATNRHQQNFNRLCIMSSITKLRQGTTLNVSLTHHADCIRRLSRFI